MNEPAGEAAAPGLSVGDEVEVDVTAYAHGGHCIARHNGQVLFVRHTLPGERVRALVTSLGSGGRFVRADAIDIITAVDARVEPPCPFAGPGRCGGCDLQHADLPTQRALKAGVIAEQFDRLAGERVSVDVQPVPGDSAGLGWRSRVSYAVDEQGRAGLRRHRSHDLEHIDRCLIATARVNDQGVPGRQWPDAEAVEAIDPSVGPAVVAVEPNPTDAAAADVGEVVSTLWRTADGDEVDFSHTFRVGARTFWQVHRGAAATLVRAVFNGLDVRPGDRALDLYAGVGLFALPLARAVGADGAVVAVESDPTSCDFARTNLQGLGQAHVLSARVDDAFGVARAQRGPRRRPTRRRPVRSPLMPPRADVVVLDPPRTGAGPGVAAAVAALEPRVIAYVACDPAALARDAAALERAGYRLDRLRAFDAFPMTHHVECVAHFVPAAEVVSTVTDAGNPGTL